LETFQNSAGEGSQKHHFILKFTQIRAWSWTRWPPETPSNLSFFCHSQSYSYPSKLCDTSDEASDQNAFNKAVIRVFTLKRISGLAHTLFTSRC